MWKRTKMAKRIIIDMEKEGTIEKEELTLLEKEDRLQSILDNIPTSRNRRKRTKKLLRKILPYIHFTEDNDVLYSNDDRGSGIVDLLLYLVTDPNAEIVSSSRQPPPKPTDLKKFLDILKMAGVRKSDLYYKNKKPTEDNEVPIKKSKIAKKKSLPWWSLY